MGQEMHGCAPAHVSSAHTHTHTHARARAQAHTHTHTHTLYGVVFTGHCKQSFELMSHLYAIHTNAPTFPCTHTCTHTHKAPHATTDPKPFNLWCLTTVEAHVGAWAPSNKAKCIWVFLAQQRKATSNCYGIKQRMAAENFLVD